MALHDYFMRTLDFTKNYASGITQPPMLHLLDDTVYESYSIENPSDHLVMPMPLRDTGHLKRSLKTMVQSYFHVLQKMVVIKNQGFVDQRRI